MGFHLNPGLALAEVHGGIAAAALGPPQQEEQTPEQDQGEEEAAHRLLPGRRFAVRLHGDVHVVVREDFEEVLVGGEVHHGPLAIVLHHLGGAAVGGDQHPRDLVRLNGLNEIAVADGSGGSCRIGAFQEGGSQGDEDDHQQGIEPRIAPAFLQGRASR